MRTRVLAPVQTRSPWLPSASSCVPPAWAVQCGGLCAYGTAVGGDLARSWQPIVRGGPLPMEASEEAFSKPQSGQPSSPFSRMAVPTLASRRYTAPKTRDGTGTGVAWASHGTLQCRCYTVYLGMCTHTHRRASLGTANGHFLLDRQLPISAKTAAQSTNNYGPRLPGSQALPGLEPALVPQSREISLQIESIYV